MLGLAVARAQPDLLALLLAHGGDPNGRYHDGAPLLSAAILSTRLDLVRALVEHGADLNTRPDVILKRAPAQTPGPPAL